MGFWTGDESGAGTARRYFHPARRARVTVPGSITVYLSFREDAAIRPG
jgi:hypothetical protein